MKDTAALDELNALAAEMALGLLDGPALQAARARLIDDPDFAARVAGWQGRLAGMTDAIAPVEVPARLKTAIDDRIFAPTRPAPFLRRVGVWQFATLCALALAGGLGYLLWQNTGARSDAAPRQAVLDPTFSAELQSADGALSVTTLIDPKAGQITVQRPLGEAAPGRALELWAIVPGREPFTLGVLPAERTARITLPGHLKILVSQLTIAISSEAPGGAPDAKPSGPYLATDRTKKIN